MEPGMQINDELKKRLLKDQQDEITAHHLYKAIAGFIKDEENKAIILRVSEQELKHYNQLKAMTGVALAPQRWKLFFFYWITRLLGVTFGIKLLERSEQNAIENYDAAGRMLPVLQEISGEEEQHEQKLIGMIDEERLNYMGAIVLGLNDALVELTGALAGFTFAFQNTRLIALTGLITGISASLSMAASEYLSTTHEGGEHALKSAVYTGSAYVFTVICLILPYLLIGNPYISLGVTLLVAVAIIFFFNYYIAVAKDYNFRKRFLEMAGISLGVAAVSFLIGVLIKRYIGVDV